MSTFDLKPQTVIEPAKLDEARRLIEEVARINGRNHYINLGAVVSEEGAEAREAKAQEVRETFEAQQHLHRLDLMMIAAVNKREHDGVKIEFGREVEDKKKAIDQRNYYAHEYVVYKRKFEALAKRLKKKGKKARR